MTMAGRFSFKNGEEVIAKQYPNQLSEIERVIASVCADKLKTKVSKEKTMPGRVLYNPRALTNQSIKCLTWESVWCIL